MPPNTASPVYSRAFNVVLVACLALQEGLMRAGTGHSAVTVIPARPNSRASERVKPVIEALVAE